MPDTEFPYSITPDDKPITFNMNVQDQMDIYKDNEKHQSIGIFCFKIHF